MYESIIIGAGFSSAILNLKLKDKNIKVFDKGRGPGGRSSSRRIVNIGVFDHGLKYISLKNQSFKFFLDQHLSPFIKKWKSKINLLTGVKKTLNWLTYNYNAKNIRL